MRGDGDRFWFSVHGGRRAELLRQRARVLRSIRAFFDGRGFLEVETPLAVPSPGMDVHLAAASVEGLGANRDFLITSPEYQMKRLLSAGFDRIYQICRCFRREERGDRHHPEFTMLEWYRTSAGSRHVMDDTEALVAGLAIAMHGAPRIPGLQGRGIDVSTPWERLSVRDAFGAFANRALEEVLPDEELFFRVLSEEIEPHLGKTRPVFLTGYPASMASLARLDPDDPSVADRFEAYVDGVELCNGFGELTDPVEQRARFERDQAARRGLGKDVYPIDDRFIRALEEGMPPSGGNALGVDRLVMLLTGASHIDDVVSFAPDRL